MITALALQTHNFRNNYRFWFKKISACDGSKHFPAIFMVCFMQFVVAFCEFIPQTDCQKGTAAVFKQKS